MAYDEDLANRVREVLGERVDSTEIAMFGGLAFMVNTHMACGPMGEDLLVRVGKDGHDEALADGAREFDFTGRPMRGFVVVPGHLLADETTLRGWVSRGVEVALALPPKAPKPPRRRPPKDPRTRPSRGRG